jgi:hypothetical protein
MGWFFRFVMRLPQDREAGQGKHRVSENHDSNHDDAMAGKIKNDFFAFGRPGLHNNISQTGNGR